MISNNSSPEFEKQLASTASSFTVNYFYKKYVDGELILRPPFQRNLVWNVEQQSFLVDSILRGLPVPEIYVQNDTTADGDELMIVVDGQQRISTCISFLAGELRIIGDGDLDEKWRNKKFDELEDALKKRFRSFELIVRKLPEETNSVLREVFRRLNKTVEPLEAQELRHAAYSGPFLELVEAAAGRPLLSEIGVFSSKDYLRRRNDEFFGEICFSLATGAFPNKKDGLEDLFLTYERQGIPQEVLNDLNRKLGRIFEQLAPIAGQLRRTRFRNKSDFYSLLLCLGKNAHVLPTNDPENLTQVLKDFSNRINDVKKEESEGRPIESLVKDNLGQHAVKYLRAVERAASDRLNRVRRDEALRGILLPILMESPSRPLVSSDESWRHEGEEVDEAVDEDAELDNLTEKEALQQALLASD
ncbi:DUF262 domain-containing protein [Kineosporia mesophila]|uniref:DUF262 domain-containing protein n=1 Tax=Kineosporia mesophila TaxID=566012 RepID=UPI001E303096|nr:DUF262 domain-containing protein [Kineosporia mesophila]